jgi:hypothetical protein
VTFSGVGPTFIISGDWLLLYIHVLFFVIDFINNDGDSFDMQTQAFSWSERNVNSLNKRIRFVTDNSEMNKGLKF